MIASAERTDGRTDDLLKKAAISLSRRLEQCGRRRQAWGNWRGLERASKKNNWLPVRCCSSATWEVCLLRCEILLACVRACVRCCCEEEQDTKGGVEECDPHYAAPSYSPSHNVCLTGGLLGLIYPARDLDFKTWEKNSAWLYCPGTWTSRPGNFVAFMFHQGGSYDS